HVDGERPGAGRGRRARHAAGGRDFGRVCGADRLHRVRHVLFPHSRALRFARPAVPGKLSRRPARERRVSGDLLSPVTVLIAVPLIAAAVLAVWSGPRFSSMFNVIANLTTFVASLTLPVERPEPTSYIFIDDFNVYLVVLTTFVAFTTSWFSASYIDHEVATGRLTPVTLRFYHAMDQLLTGAMIICLVANNIVLMWVALEAATITTVVMVSLYRTRESIEAAWKYFILASVGIALALFGTILIYLAARPHFDDGVDAL